MTAPSAPASPSGGAGRSFAILILASAQFVVVLDSSLMKVDACDG